MQISTWCNISGLQNASFVVGGTVRGGRGIPRVTDRGSKKYDFIMKLMKMTALRHFLSWLSVFHQIVHSVQLVEIDVCKCYIRSM